MPDPNEIVLVRHGATEWSVTRQHTGRTDIPLTDQGREQAHDLGERLRRWQFALVLTSPLQRARDTAQLAGVSASAGVDDDLREWDYGDFEGLTTVQIREQVPGWTVWSGPCPGGESADDVGARAEQVLQRVDGVQGAVALFSHGHFLRVLTARWLGLPAVDGRLFALDTATICVLGYEHETRVIQLWNV